ncbi:unnamed protein product [Effrenium voratum]|nr:unnamed protein product [Effrenium voratum]
MDTQGVRVLLEKQDDFEPTDEEVKNYAEWLGLDPKEDEDLLHLAREGLKAPLGEGWKPCTNENEEVFYFNFMTGSTSWTHPADEEYRARVQELKRNRTGQKSGLNVLHAPYSGLGHRPIDGANGLCSCLRRVVCCRRRRSAAPALPR